jgi:hypothetical protein
MAHLLERSSCAPPTGVWSEAAHRHPDVVWYVGTQPTGIFGLKFNLHLSRHSLPIGRLYRRNLRALPGHPEPLGLEIPTILRVRADEVIE